MPTSGGERRLHSSGVQVLIEPEHYQRASDRRGGTRDSLRHVDLPAGRSLTGQGYGFMPCRSAAAGERSWSGPFTPIADRARDAYALIEGAPRPRPPRRPLDHAGHEADAAGTPPDEGRSGARSLTRVLDCRRRDRRVHWVEGVGPEPATELIGSQHRRTIARADIAGFDRWGLLRSRAWGRGVSKPPSRRLSAEVQNQCYERGGPAGLVHPAFEPLPESPAPCHGLRSDDREQSRRRQLDSRSLTGAWGPPRIGLSCRCSRRPVD
jgi:hypothetical protein